jgi:diguanylate cyclase (GGDEF)-like protein
VTHYIWGMAPVNTLVVEPDKDRSTRILAITRSLKLQARLVESAADAGYAVAEAPTEIVIISDRIEDCERLCDALRLAHEHETLHVIAIVESVEEGRVESLLAASADDIVDWSRGPAELLLRLRVALRAVQRQHSVADEREFFRRAVQLEEDLASKVLDENMGLKALYEKLQDGSRTTPITGLLNFHTMQNALDAEVERSMRSYHPLAGFLLALDHSESLRTRIGLEAINRVMARVGRELTVQLRKYDVAGHYYDGTIFVGLPGTDLDRAYLVANRVHASTVRAKAQSAGLGGDVTMSIGVAQYRENEPRDTWLDRARKALARAQECGGAHIQREPLFGRTSKLQIAL